MDKHVSTERLLSSGTVRMLAEKHGKFIDKVREVKVRNQLVSAGVVDKVSVVFSSVCTFNYIHWSCVINITMQVKFA